MKVRFDFHQGSLVAVGTHKGYVQIWDAAGGRKLTSLEGHSARVGQSHPVANSLSLSESIKHVVVTHLRVLDSRSEIRDLTFVSKVPWPGTESSCRRGVGTE